MVAALTKAGADVDSDSWGGRTPLFCAAVAGRLAAFKELRKAKANPLLSVSFGSRGGTIVTSCWMRWRFMVDRRWYAS